MEWGVYPHTLFHHTPKIFHTTKTKTSDTVVEGSPAVHTTMEFLVLSLGPSLRSGSITYYRRGM